MTTVEFQLTKSELVFSATWQSSKRPSSIIFTVIYLMLAIICFIVGAQLYMWTMLACILLFHLVTLVQMYSRVTSNPSLMARTRISFGESGIIRNGGGVRTESTWESFYSWSQSKNYFYLNFDKLGNAYFLPQKAFTSEQREEFLRLVKKIYHSSSSKIGLTTRPLPALIQDQIMSIESVNPAIGRVFLSYAREDVDTATRLFNGLRKSGVDVWLDREVLLPGQNWKAVIRQAIIESRFFLALLSNNSVSKKGYVQKELKHALEILDEYPETAIFIIPVRLDDCNPTGKELQDLHWIDIFNDWDQGLEKIIKTIHSQSNT